MLLRVLGFLKGLVRLIIKFGDVQAFKLGHDQFLLIIKMFVLKVSSTRGGGHFGNIIRNS